MSEIKLKDKYGIKGKFRVIKTNSLTGEVISVSEYYNNLVVNGSDTGLNIILDRLNSVNAYSLNITHLDIGTNATTPANSDTTALTGAVARTNKATGVVSGNLLTTRFFFTSAELANGTYNDVRVVIDGTASLGTGQLFSRALFGTPYTKGTNEDTTIEYVYNISNT